MAGGVARAGSSEHVRAVAHVDLGAIERNCATLKRRLGDADLCAVVKADGYGHGATPCARSALAGGATWLAVATAPEAAALRVDGIGGPILVMGALTDTELAVALDAGADVVAWREEFVRAVAAAAAAGPARVHVKLDTGMGRLGAKDPDQARAVAGAVDASERLELAGVMTHFATADDEGSDFFDEQLRRFRPFAEELKRSHPGCIAHAANSAAVLRSETAHFDMARCGIAVYGMDPFGEDPALRGLEPALAIHSYVAEVKTLSAGESVGYGRTWVASEQTSVAVLPIGYGDGYRRGLSNAAEVLIRGRRFPVVGTISMDNITVEVGGAEVEVGDSATLIGADADERVTAEELAHRLDTINYEITCGVSARVPRVNLSP
jgi:alanine racemase